MVKMDRVEFYYQVRPWPLYLQGLLITLLTNYLWEICWILKLMKVLIILGPTLGKVHLKRIFIKFTPLENNA